MSADVGPIGSSFASFLHDEGMLAEADAGAIKAVIAWQVDRWMRERGLSKAAMARAMGTTRAQLDRVLDPENTGLSLITLHRAAAALGCRLRVELEPVEVSGRAVDDLRTIPPEGGAGLAKESHARAA